MVKIDSDYRKEIAGKFGSKYRRVFYAKTHADPRIGGNGFILRGLYGYRLCRQFARARARTPLLYLLSTS
jgi:hypothetical protein